MTKKIHLLSNDKLKAVDLLLNQQNSESVKEEEKNVSSSNSSVESQPKEEITEIQQIENVREEKIIKDKLNKKRVSIPALEEILNSKNDSFSNSKACGIHITQEHLNKLNILTYLADKKNYNRSILANIIDLFFELYKEEIDNLKKTKINL